jgi:hypothetical protein
LICHESSECIDLATSLRYPISLLHWPIYIYMDYAVGKVIEKIARSLLGLVRLRRIAPGIVPAN